MVTRDLGEKMEEKLARTLAAGGVCRCVEDLLQKFRLKSALRRASDYSEGQSSPLDDVLDLEPTARLDESVRLHQINRLAKLAFCILDQLLSPHRQRLEELLDDDRRALGPSSLAADGTLAIVGKGEIGAHR
jgi:hypothetical protein